MGLKLRFYDVEMSTSLLPQGTPAPTKILAEPFSYFMRTRDEVTLICPTKLLPENVLKSDSGWIPMEFVGPFAFDEIGIMTQVANPLAAVGVSILAVATFGTDYILIKKEHREKATEALKKAGHLFL